MNKLFEVKGYLSKYYGKYSNIVDKATKFIVALLSLTFINQNIGFSEIVSKPFMSIILSAICMMLPIPMTVVFITIATMLQLLTVSTGAALVAGIMFIIMYGFYLRYAPGKAIVVLLVPIAFMLRIPVTVPIVLGLIGSPICILPMSMGTMAYYLIDYMKSNSTLLETPVESGLMEQMATYAQQILVNREMWCNMIAFAICLLLVYNVRRMSVDYSWEIAIVAGILGNINVMAYGYILMDIQLSYISLIVGSIVAVLVALIVKFFVFAVDYTRTERLQYEDDEYYYYVKAVPKSSVAIPEKTVKRINEHQKMEETE
ncbi:MAG: hypothetical protein IJA54_00780 [Tyzzerella sp.]|nr:hypothetical protein [Tyzzerella sp.]